MPHETCPAIPEKTAHEQRVVSMCISRVLARVLAINEVYKRMLERLRDMLCSNILFQRMTQRGTPNDRSHSPLSILALHASLPTQQGHPSWGVCELLTLTSITREHQ